MMTKKRQSGLTMIEVLIASIILTALVGMASWLVWSSSNHVATEEGQIQAEALAREVMNQLMADIRASSISKGMLKGYIGSSWKLPADGDVFTAIDIYMPSSKADVVDSDGNSRGFNLATFNAGSSPGLGYWNKRVIYTWIVDPGNNSSMPEIVNGIDDNKNNLIDEGMIQKQEWIPNYNTGTAPVNPTTSIISRYIHNVNNLNSKYVGLKFVARAQTPGGTPNRIDITLTIQKNDPKYNNSKMNLGTTDLDQDISQSIIKTVTDTVVLRN